IYGDGGLVSEGLQQGDLAVGERPDLVPIDKDHAEQLVCPDHGDREYGMKWVHLPRAVSVIGVGLSIMDVHGAPPQGGTRRSAARSGRNGILLDEGSDLGGGVVGGHDAQQLTVEAE